LPARPARRRCNEIRSNILSKENIVPLNRLLSICALSLLVPVIGCSSPSQATGPSFTLYAVQNNTGIGGSSVLTLPVNNGQIGQSSVTPTSTITVPMQTSFQALAVDNAGNVYVSASVVTAPPLLNEILVYAAGATGAATPARTIALTNPSTQTVAISIAVDATGSVYALNGNNISVFAPGASGNAAPARLITGNLTQLNAATGIAVDSAQNIYVANTNGGNVLVFSSTETGNVAPASILAGTATGISTPVGLTLDSAGDLYVASYNQTGNSSLVLEFAPGASGNASPTRTLTAVASDTLAGMAVDALDNLYVFTQAPTSNQLAIDVFSPSATGTAAPYATITSSAWTASNFGQIAVR
jgi:hypothetical protein